MDRLDAARLLEAAYHDVKDTLHILSIQLQPLRVHLRETERGFEATSPDFDWVCEVDPNLRSAYERAAQSIQRAAVASGHRQLRGGRKTLLIIPTALD